VLPASRAYFEGLGLRLWRGRTPEGTGRELFDGEERERSRLDACGSSCVEEVSLLSCSDVRAAVAWVRALADEMARDIVRAAAAAVGEEERFSREDVVLETSGMLSSGSSAGSPSLCVDGGGRFGRFKRVCCF